MIKVKRNRDGKIFTNDMSQEDCIYEIHFCTSYTQVLVREKVDGFFTDKEIIIKPIGTEPCSFFDMIAVGKDDDWGEWVNEGLL